MGKKFFDPDTIDFQLKRTGVIVGWMFIIVVTAYIFYLTRGVFYWILNVLTSFLAAAVLAYILHPMVCMFQRRLRLNRVWGLIVVYTLLIIVALGFFSVFGGILSQQVVAASSAMMTTVPDAIQNVFFPKRLRSADVKDFAALISRLKSGEDGPSVYFRKNMPEDLAKALQEHEESSEDSEEFQSRVLKYLNTMILERDFYGDAPASWNDVQLSEQAKKEARKPSEERKPVLLNRLLVESAWPDLIKPIAFMGRAEDGGEGEGDKGTLRSWLPEGINEGNYMEEIQRILPVTKKILDAVYTNFQMVLSNLWGGISAAVGLVVFLAFVFIITIYFLLDIQAFSYFLRVIVPDDQEDRVFKILNKMDHAVGGFIRGQIIVCISVGAITTVGLLLLGFHTPALAKYCLLIGIAAGAANFIPYLGPILASAPSILIVLMAPSDEATFQYRLLGVGGIILLSAFIQTFEGFVLQPYVVGGASHLSPLIVMLALIAGSKFGLGGMIVAVPVAAMTRVLLKELWWDDLVASQAWNQPAPSRRNNRNK